MLFSFDTDLLAEVHRCQVEEIFFAGVIYAHPLQVSIGDCVKDLEIIGKASEPEDLANRVEYLPLYPNLLFHLKF